MNVFLDFLAVFMYFNCSQFNQCQKMGGGVTDPEEQQCPPHGGAAGKHD